MTEHHTAKISDDQGLFIPVRPIDAPLEVSEKYIRSSPYYEQEHLLDLDKLDLGYRALALALQSFEARSEKDYAFAAYKESFNIDSVILRAREYAATLGAEEFPETKVYIIAFRSILHLDVQESAEKRKKLAEIDKDSHTEANLSGGLLKYWFGTPDDVHAKNLATCWWRNGKDAKAGGGGPAHRQGMRLVKGWFKHWQVEEYELLITKDGHDFGPLKKILEKK